MYINYNNPTIQDCVNMVRRLHAEGRKWDEAVRDVADTYYVPVSDLMLLLDMYRRAED